MRFSLVRFFGAGFLAALVLIASLPMPAQQTVRKPDFSGRWRMLKDKSNFAGFKMPDMVVRVVDQHDPILNLHTVQTSGEKTSMSDVSYSTDGAITQNVINGRNAESKAYWDGQILVIRTSMKTAKGDDEVIEDRWQLSNDGQTLTTTSHVATSKGEVDMTLVCAKERSEPRGSASASPNTRPAKTQSATASQSGADYWP